MPAPSGTKAVLAGYPQDRAFAMTADRDCELRRKNRRRAASACTPAAASTAIPARRSWSARGGKRDANRRHPDRAFQSGGTEKMLAVPAQAIRDHASMIRSRHR